MMMFSKQSYNKFNEFFGYFNEDEKEKVKELRNFQEKEIKYLKLYLYKFEIMKIFKYLKGTFLKLQFLLTESLFYNLFY